MTGWPAASTALTRGLVLGEAAPAPADPTSYYYAAWVSVDMRLLMFLALISLLTALGSTVFFVRRQDPILWTASFIVAFTISLGLLVAIFNTIAAYPVFVVQSFFPFP